MPPDQSSHASLIRDMLRARNGEGKRKPVVGAPACGGAAPGALRRGAKNFGGGPAGRSPGVGGVPKLSP